MLKNTLHKNQLATHKLLYTYFVYKFKTINNTKTKRIRINYLFCKGRCDDVNQNQTKKKCDFQMFDLQPMIFLNQLESNIAQNICTKNTLWTNETTQKFDKWHS